MLEPRKLPSGKWQARITDPLGKTVSVGVYPTKREAEKVARANAVRVDNGQWVDDTKGQQTLEEFAAYVLKVRTDLAPRTRDNYRGYFNRHIIPTLGKLKLKDIRKQHIKLWWADQPERPVRKHALNALSMVLRTALDEDEISANPVAGAIRNASKGVEKPRPFLSPEQFWSIHDQCPEHVQIMLRTVIDGSLRIGEALGLDRNHVSFKTGMLTVEQQYAVEAGGAVLRAGTKTGGTRTVRLSPDVLEALQAHVKANPVIGKAPLFTGPQGRRLSRNQVYWAWNAARAKVGLEWAHVHDLRHSGLTLFTQNGATLREVMDRGGHKDHRSALRYQHADPARQEGLATAMGNALRRA